MWRDQVVEIAVSLSAAEPERRVQRVQEVRPSLAPELRPHFAFAATDPGRRPLLSDPEEVCGCHLDDPSMLIDCLSQLAAKVGRLTRGEFKLRHLGETGDDPRHVTRAKKPWIVFRILLRRVAVDRLQTTLQDVQMLPDAFRRRQEPEFEEHADRLGVHTRDGERPSPASIRTGPVALSGQLVSTTRKSERCASTTERENSSSQASSEISGRRAATRYRQDLVRHGWSNALHQRQAGVACDEATAEIRAPPSPLPQDRQHKSTRAGFQEAGARSRGVRSVASSRPFRVHAAIDQRRRM